ncbi:hypothetical protein IRM70_06950 [Erwinia amylovora]|nr:hypothetical protein [Erwinia amylovora]UDK90882.1 hypothetical protein IRM70_06950 [Erwinia amylovora]
MASGACRAACSPLSRGQQSVIKAMESPGLLTNAGFGHALRRMTVEMPS